MQKHKIALLGATGAVGQRFLDLLQNHPYFETAALCGSERSAGKKYKDAVNWIVSKDIPEKYKEMEVILPDPSKIPERVEIIFSAIPPEAAKDIEGGLAKAGYKIFSNTRTFRMEEDVPLLVAEINADKINIIEKQKDRGWKGFIVTNPNCIAIPLSIALKPIYDAFGIKQAVVSTMQAISGAGYPGVASLDIVDNVIPFIGGEEPKVISETQKILDAKFPISPSCHRVAVIDGHMIDARISLEKKASPKEVKEVLRLFKGQTEGLNLPSAPSEIISVREEDARPQPRVDRMAGNGMGITVGRVREGEVLENEIKMIILGHNTIRGAAGCSLLNAEYYLKKF